tara:strand:- start:283 stop:609 length:327 start_codon:yes stop_codon:yes gene_type:complete
MSKKIDLNLTKIEYETIYRILITSNVETMAEQRGLNSVLDEMESAGFAVGDDVEGLPQMFTIKPGTPAQLRISSASAKVMADHIESGIGRFQTWAVRSLPGVIDRLKK